MVHVTRSFRPEIVLFGHDQRLQTPFTLEGGKSIIVRVNRPDRVVVSRFAVGEPDREMVVSDRLEEIIRAVIDVGGHYPDVVGLLHAAKMESRLATASKSTQFHKPAGRTITANGRPRPARNSNSSKCLASLPNLFGRRAAHDQDDSTSEPSKDADTDVN